MSKDSESKIAEVENALRKRGLSVINLCEPKYRLGSLDTTNNRVKRCYAERLNSCQGSISGEHFISESILAQFETIPTSGIPWLEGRVSEVSASQLTANCLCEYHNSYLSPLDDLAGKAFASFRKFMNLNEPHTLIWGPSLERWFLKVLVGLVGARQVEVGGNRVLPENIESEWLEVLFGLRDFSQGHGLYMTPMIGQALQLGGSRLSLTTLLLEGELRGIRINLSGFEFTLSMASREDAFNRSHPGYGNILYRPRGINFGQTENKIAIFWND